MTNQPMLGVMLDCSRNAVPNMQSAKHFIDCLEKMGYNTLMYYTEDTYEVENEPYFGYLRGRFTAEELRELDAYSEAHGIELVPCVQTLAHLRTAFRWSAYTPINDTADILLMDDERTYLLIENIFRSLRACFKTDQVHIGMDEAHMMGLGKYLDQHGFCDRRKIFLRHLNRVCRIADKYGFRPMIWHDMLFASTKDRAESDEALAEFRKQLPENLAVVYWNYYNTDEATYRAGVNKSKKLGDKAVFAGGVWTWSGFVPANRTTFAVTKPALDACRKEGITDVLFTMWGDDGAECSPFSVLPTLWYAAELYRGNDDIESIKAKFYELFGESYDDVLSMGELNLPLNIKREVHVCSAKVMLYNDVLLGIFDPSIPDDAEEKYADFEKHFAACAERDGRFAPHFRVCAELAHVLRLKARIGIELRAAYKADDREALKKLAARLTETAQAMREFLSAFRALWMSEKRPHGFDVQDIRLGGAVTRVESAARRVSDYANGKIERIDELEETLLPDDESWNWWARTATVNVL